MGGRKFARVGAEEERGKLGNRIYHFRIGPAHKPGLALKQRLGSPESKAWLAPVVAYWNPLATTSTASLGLGGHPTPNDNHNHMQLEASHYSNCLGKCMGMKLCSRVQGKSSLSTPHHLVWYSKALI